MAGFNEMIGRGNVVIPEPIANSIVEAAIEQSVLMRRARIVRMSSKTERQPVLSTLPEAFWLNGDTALKQTTSANWTLPVLTAEELATIAIVPDAVREDTTIPIWQSLTPWIAAAIGKKVDAAAMFGTEKPASWPTDIVHGAIASGQSLTLTAAGLGDSAALLSGQIAEESGYSVNGFVGGAGLNWKLISSRTNQYNPEYANGSLFGIPVDEMKNGAWDSAAAEMVAVDWNNVVLGIRQDITVKQLDQAVISDDAGKVIFNLAQQDAMALRVVFRVGFQVLNPATGIAGDTGYPAGVITA